MHSGEPRQEVRSRQGSCVCVCAWLHSGEGRTAHFNVHALSVSDRSTCSTNSQLLPLPRRPPAISGLPIFRMVSPEWRVVHADLPVADPRQRRYSGGAPVAVTGAERRTVGRPAPPHRPPQQPAAPGWFGESRCAAFPLAITISPLLVRATCQRRPVARRGLSSPFPDQLITLVLVVWSVAAWS